MKMKLIRSCSCLLALLVLLAATGCGSVSQDMAQKVLEAMGDDVGGELEEGEAGELAFGAVLATRNSMHYRTMFGMSDLYLEAMEDVLVDAWDITDRASAIDTLDWLRDEGHRLPSSPEYYGYDEIYLIIAGQAEADDYVLEMFAAELEGYEAICEGLIADYGYTREELDAVATMSAWDYDRMVTVARWCAGIGYITDEEAWAYVDYAANAGRADYDSWREYFAGALFGRAIWSEDGTFSGDDRDIAKKLLLSDDSIYNTVSF